MASNTSPSPHHESCRPLARPSKRALRCAYSIALGATLLCVPAGCAARALAAEDLMANVQPQTTGAASATLTDQQSAIMTDFAIRLLQETDTGQENMLVSPLSVEHALGMTANGAQGETRAQMETAFGMPIDELNKSLHAYTKSLESKAAADSENASATSPDAASSSTASGDEASESPLKLANSLWVREGISVNRDFLQANANWYGAGAYEAPFDASTVTDINQWVSDHTDAMIDSIVDEIPASAALYLVNALAFEDDWALPYESEQVQDATFTTQDGTQQSTPLMYSTENLYLEGAEATGFVKQYKNPRYAFAALLPNAGTSVDDLVANLDGAELQSILSSAEYATIDAALPKFESEYATELSAPLAALGMKDAFDASRADFSGIAAEGSLCINRVLHKTYIAVDEKGTKAAAVTAVEAKATSAGPAPEEVKVVHLDRPFAYFIIDAETNLPIFAGIMRSAG